MSSRHGAQMICTPIGSGVERDRHADDRQSDKRNRLRVDAEVRPHRHLDTVEDEGLLADGGRGAGRCRRKDRIDLVEQFEHLGRDTSGGISAP